MGTNYTNFTDLRANGDFYVCGNAAITGNLSVSGALSAAKLLSLVTLGTVEYDAASGEAATLYTLPEGAVLIKAICVVNEAFNSGDGDVLILGTAVDDGALMGLSEIDETAEAAYQKDVWLVGGAGGTAIKAKLTKSGTEATEGAAQFFAIICFVA